jgi:two-component system OmpR family response regulator
MARILCADDNRDLADTNATLLRMAGYEVRVCYDGADALTAAEEFRPDVCLLDLNMPGLPGEHLAVWIRARANGRRPVLVALTGYGREQDIRRTELAGFDVHLVKPVEPDRLLDTVRKVAAVWASPAGA